jgi:hypothetical protein
VISVRRLIQELPIEVVCFNHGPPILRGGRRSLERALLRDLELLPVAPVHPD